MKKPRIDGRTALLLHALDEAFGKAAWHGAHLRGALRGVTARQAEWRPGPGRHNIRELVVHAAYWKHRVRRRLAGQRSRAFPMAGSNWLALSPVSASAWQAERDLLDEEQEALRRVVAAFPALRLEQALPRNPRRTAMAEILGIALHDVYHTGQIQLLKVLHRQGRKR